MCGTIFRPKSAPEALPHPIIWHYSRPGTGPGSHSNRIDLEACPSSSANCSNDPGSHRCAHQDMRANVTLQESAENADFERTAVTSTTEDEGNFMRRVDLRSIAAALTAALIHFF